jgi:hypothetical protein
MQPKLYTNIPIEKSGSSSDATFKYFDQYYDKPIDLDNNAMLAVKSFFEKRGFEPASAETTAIVILSQAKRDNINPIKIIDTLNGMSNVEISGLVSEILNYHRFKTSSLGISISPISADEIQRNILA